MQSMYSKTLSSELVMCMVEWNMSIFYFIATEVDSIVDSWLTFIQELLFFDKLGK